VSGGVASGGAIPGLQGAGVTFNGKCYAAFDVSYALYGRMLKNCGYWSYVKGSLAYHSFKVKRGHSAQRRFHAGRWMEWGRGWPSIPWLPSPDNIKRCKPCPEKVNAPIKWRVGGASGRRYGSR